MRILATQLAPGSVQRVRVLATEAMDLLASPVGPPAPFDALLEYEAKAGEARRS